MMSEENESVQDTADAVCVIILLLIFIPATIAGALIDGWVITILWKWFVVGSFGLAAMPIKMAVGLSFIFDMFKLRFLPKETRRMKALLPVYLFSMLVFPFMVLAFAKLTLLFM